MSYAHDKLRVTLCVGPTRAPTRAPTTAPTAAPTLGKDSGTVVVTTIHIICSSFFVCHNITISSAPCTFGVPTIVVCVQIHVMCTMVAVSLKSSATVEVALYRVPHAFLDSLAVAKERRLASQFALLATQTCRRAATSRLRFPRARTTPHVAKVIRQVIFQLDHHGVPLDLMRGQTTHSVYRAQPSYPVQIFCRLPLERPYVPHLVHFCVSTAAMSVIVSKERMERLSLLSLTRLRANALAIRGLHGWAPAAYNAIGLKDG